MPRDVVNRDLQPRMMPIPRAPRLPRVLRGRRPRQARARSHVEQRLAEHRFPAGALGPLGVIALIGAIALLSIVRSPFTFPVLAESRVRCEPTPEYVRGYDHTGKRTGPARREPVTRPISCSPKIDRVSRVVLAHSRRRNQLSSGDGGTGTRWCTAGAAAAAFRLRSADATFRF